VYSYFVELSRLIRTVSWDPNQDSSAQLAGLNRPNFGGFKIK